MPRSQEPLTIAFIHHANQFLITDGYNDKTGISSVVGTPESDTGLLRVLETHLRYRVPLNLHISGTLLESLAWHSPGFFSQLEHLIQDDLLELVGSSYGQNMMRFFSPEHNHRQLREQLLLYENFLEWKADRVKTFWVPERLWDTDALAPVLAEGGLQNGGYRYVIVDDRLLYPSNGNPSPRRVYDKTQTWDPENFLMYRIRDGQGLCALPISNNLRQNIPPRSPQNFDRVTKQLQWLFDLNPDFDNGLIAIYGDDMEKAAGVGWDKNGPSQYEGLLKWISKSPWLRPVTLRQWAASHPPVKERTIDGGSYVELVNEFDADETYRNWYEDPRWAPYQAYYEWSHKRVEELDSLGADPGLIELARKILLATVWQTAWHTPKTGAHGEADSDGGPSAWVKAVTSHSRLAAIMAEAAYWMSHKDGHVSAYLQDLDKDMDSELIVRNDSLLAVFSPRNGGRLIALFSISKSPGRLVVGNPIDDWNLKEDLHDYMDVPANHPGAFSDLGFEHDTFQPRIQHREGNTVTVTLQDLTPDSPGFGLEKTVKLNQGEATVQVNYTLPGSMGRFSTEIGVSPDYLKLLRHGETSVREMSSTGQVRGWMNEDVRVWVGLDEDAAFWDTPRQKKFGHGYLVRVTSLKKNFTVRLGVEMVN